MSATSATRVPAAFSRSNCETEPTCARAERNTRTASNDPDIRPSLVRLGAQNGPQRRSFRAVPRRLSQQPDSVAERGGFEPSRPFISCMLPRFHAHLPSPGRTLTGKNEVHGRSSTSRSAGPQGPFPRTSLPCYGRALNRRIQQHEIGVHDFTRVWRSVSRGSPPIFGRTTALRITPSRVISSFTRTRTEARFAALQVAQTRHTESENIQNITVVAASVAYPGPSVRFST
jgi:hypothetical protein